jgi:preprotein translocase subunit SecB
MSPNANVPLAGFQLTKLFFVEQTYTAINDEEVEAPKDERVVQVGWNWRIRAAREFEVALTVEIEPSRICPDHAKVTAIGMFKAGAEPLSVPFSDFVRQNSVAILIPYAREALTSLTARGLTGAFYLSPMNAVLLAKNFDPADTDGARQLTEGGDLAANFGLEYYDDKHAPPPVPTEG